MQKRLRKKQIEENKNYTMDEFQHLHMNGGTGKTSYSSNSYIQRKAISRTKPIIEEAILDILAKQYGVITSSKSLGIADLGCSSGPTSLLVVSYLMDIIFNRCRELGRASPDFLVFLNDLPSNDFNTLFKSLQGFYHEQMKNRGDGFGGSCFIAGMPGTFYGRLFPCQSLHFVHSSYSLHWLSQVPERIGSLNKGNIYAAKSSPPAVLEAYQKQFQRDFTVFLRSRSAEIVGGGGMILTLLGRTTENHCGKECCGCYLWELLAVALLDMVNLGMINEEKLDLFNLPHYSPSLSEVKYLIESEGSFIVNRLETFKFNWDVEDAEDNVSIDDITNTIRAVSEPLLVSHFGEKLIIEKLFHRYRQIVADGLSREESKYINIVISMTRNLGD